jgi:hypothetical protein
MDSDIQRNREEELYFFSSSEPDDDLIPPAQGETANLAIYSLKKSSRKYLEFLRGSSSSI